MKYKLDIDPVAEGAIEHFGRAAQLAKSIEELAELIVQISKSYNMLSDTTALVDEIADATIMVRQLRYMFDYENVDSRIEYKLNRLMTRMDSEKNSEGKV